MDLVTQIALKVPETLVEISERGLATLKRAEQQRGFAKSIHTTVTNSLKELTGYSKENRPEEHTRTHFEFGDISGRVESKPTSSVSYKTVFSELSNYIQHEQQAGKKIINAELLVKNFYEMVEDSTNPTLEQKIYFDNEEEIIEEAGISDESPETTTFYTNTSNYSNLNKRTILDRFKAKRIDDHLSKEIIKPFNNLVQSTALDLLGLNEEDLQETARTTISQDNRAFDVKVISRETTGYAAILKSLFNTSITRATGRSGEIYSLIDSRIDEIDDLIERFDVRNRMQGKYVSLEKVAQRLDQLTTEHTTTRRRLEWSYNPILEFAAIAN
ncbi:hypothetical protein HOE39_00675 [Candidatus Woesearchaeota archaeon]|jgi:hypothetical protein|nr:hypothetical protein [Candidatus Woesearchaeota archaeon]